MSGLTTSELTGVVLFFSDQRESLSLAYIFKGDEVDIPHVIHACTMYSACPHVLIFWARPVPQSDFSIS